MKVLAWSVIVAWAAVLAGTDWVLATCDFDCSDSGVPFVALGVVLIAQGGLSDRDRRALVLVGVVDAALAAWLVALFVGV